MDSQRRRRDQREPAWRRRCRSGLAVLLLALSPWAGAQQAASAPAGVVSVLAADANAITLSTDATTLRQRLTLVVEHPNKGDALQLRAAALAGPGGLAAPVTLTRGALTGSSIALADAASDGLPIDVELSALLPRAGDYSGYLSLRLGDAATTVRTLKITRTIPKVPVTVLGTLRAQTSWLDWRQARLRLPLLGPLDRDVQVAPLLADLTVGANGQQATQARLAPWQVVAGGKAASAPYTVRKGLPLELELELSGFEQTGEHKGRLLLVADDLEAAGFDFTMLVRDPAWLAALLIAAGAGASMWLRRYVGSERPRLVLRRRIAELREDIDKIRRDDGAPGKAGLAVLDDFLRRLDTIEAGTRGPDALKAEWLTSSEAELTRLQDKLVIFAAWNAACRQLDAMQDPQQAATQKAKLDEVAAALRANAAVSDDLQKVLAAIPGELAEIQRKLVIAAFDELRKEAEAQLAVALPVQARSGDWAALFDALKRGSALAARGEFGTAQVDFAAARRLYAARLIDDLQARLALAAPRGLKNWDSVVDKARAGLETARGLLDGDPDAALEGYAAAYRVYLTALIDPLLAEIGNEVALSDRLKVFAEETRPELRVAAGLAANALHDATRSLALGQLRAAWTAYDKAYVGWQDAQALARNADIKQMGQTVPEPAVVAGASLPPAVAVGATVRSLVLPAARESAAELRAQTTRLDFWVDIAAIVVATLLGLNFVWAANASWGGLGDWMLALLWGLGVHQVSGYTFDGVLGLRDKLVK